MDGIALDARELEHRTSQSMPICPKYRLAVITALWLASSACGTDKAQTQAYIEDANQAILLEQWPEAQAMAELALENHPDEREARELLAGIHRINARSALDAGEPARAADEFLAAAGVEPARAQRGDDYLAAVAAGQAAGHPAAKLAPWAEEALEANPVHQEGRMLAARLWDEAGAPDRAIPHYLWIWSAEPTHYVGLQLGMLYSATRHYDDAAAILERVHLMQPDNVQVAINLADAYEQLGQNGDVFALFDALLEHYPDNAGLLFRYAAFIDRRGDAPRARRMREQAQNAMPGVERREMRKLP